MPDLPNAQWGQFIDSLKTKVLQPEVPHLSDTDRHETTVQPTTDTNAPGDGLLDEVQKELMQGAISHLPEADRREAAAQLAAGTMTLQQASTFQAKAVQYFKTCVANQQPRA